MFTQLRTQAYWIGLVIWSLLSGCDIKENKEVKPDTFVKIYNNNSYSNSYQPVDIKETSDGGFLILASYQKGETSFPNVYIIKVDKEGEFVKETELPEQYVNPVNGLLKSGNGFYFFCMDRLSLQTSLIQVFEDGSIAEVAVLQELYPLASSIDNSTGNLILLSYDREDKKTIVSRVNIAGDINAQTKFDIGFGDFDAEESIIRHFSGTGRRLPFFCGEDGSGKYYFNGYYRYTMSLVFFNFNSSSSTTVVYGFKDERALNSLVANGTFIAGSKYEYGSVSFMPRMDLSQFEGGIGSSSDLPGYYIPELESDAEVYTDFYNLQGRDLTVFGSNSRGGQIALFFYDRNTGELIKTKYLGYTNPYKIKGFVSTSEGGMAVIGQTWIADRFSRICLFKIKADELNDYLN